LRTAIATVCLSGTLNEKLEAIAAARFVLFHKHVAIGDREMTLKLRKLVASIT
jgi:hypothetical protein